MKTIYRCLLPLALALAAFAQPSTDFKFILGTGAGFKPYQTTIKSGSSAFTQGGMALGSGFYSFVRVDLRSTDAQMVLEGCKGLYRNDTNMLLACGGPGFGADANNIGLAFVGGGKWLFSPRRLQRSDTWIGIELGVAKTTVPAPVSSAGTISPVQPDFRIGIHKEFR